jgi:flavin-binding protein dodecin
LEHAFIHAFQGQCGDVSLQGGRQGPVRHTKREDDMSESIYDVIQLIGSSNESWEKAAANAVEQASKSLRDVRIAEIVELDMQLDPKGKVEAYRAKVKLSFKYEAKS